jgi:hypothetical protein
LTALHKFVLNPTFETKIIVAISMRNSNLHMVKNCKGVPHVKRRSFEAKKKVKAYISPNKQGGGRSLGIENCIELFQYKNPKRLNPKDSCHSYYRKHIVLKSNLLLLESQI